MTLIFGFSCSYLILNSSTTAGTSYIANIVTDPRIKLQALSLMNEVFKVRMELTTNGVIVRDTLNYVNGKAEKLDQQVKAEEEKEEDCVIVSESDQQVFYVLSLCFHAQKHYQRCSDSKKRVRFGSETS